ncbi:MAG: hypothetical protein ABSB31_03590 [Dehalococcoidia bacterium]|jgi:hypothetical protein
MDGQNIGCPICGADLHHPLAIYCKRCKKLIDRVDIRSKPNKLARVRALHSAWDGQGFRCHYTGVRLVEDNHNDPRYITFDHVVPRQEDEIVVVAAVINDMKSDLSDQEFRAIVAQLAGHFDGLGFDESLLKLKHWKRV